MLDLVLKNRVKLLFITPEIFVNDFVVFYLQNKKVININMICIDEAHCCIASNLTYREVYSSFRTIFNILNSAQN